MFKYYQQNGQDLNKKRGIYTLKNLRLIVFMKRTKFDTKKLRGKLLDRWYVLWIVIPSGRSMDGSNNHPHLKEISYDNNGEFKAKFKDLSQQRD